MVSWQIIKNRIDMDYQQALQRYQVMLTASYAAPAAVIGLLLSLHQSLQLQNAFLLGFLAAMLVFVITANKLEAIENELTGLKKKVEELTIK